MPEALVFGDNESYLGNFFWWSLGVFIVTIGTAEFLLLKQMVPHGFFDPFGSIAGLLALFLHTCVIFLCLWELKPPPIVLPFTVANDRIKIPIPPPIKGFVDAKELAALFRHAHAFVMPSLYEGFGLPLVEAMSCGCPVITSDRGSLPEIAGDGAQCFDPFDIKGMAQALCALLRSPEELQRKRSDALRRAADFCWDKAALETISVYHHVIRYSRPQ